MYIESRKYLEGQKAVYSIDVLCKFCNKSYHNHNNTFKHHLKTDKHKKNVKEYII